MKNIASTFLLLISVCICYQSVLVDAEPTEVSLNKRGLFSNWFKPSIPKSSISDVVIYSLVPTSKANSQTTKSGQLQFFEGEPVQITWNWNKFSTSNFLSVQLSLKGLSKAPASSGDYMTIMNNIQRIPGQDVGALFFQIPSSALSGVYYLKFTEWAETGGQGADQVTLKRVGEYKAKTVLFQIVNFSLNSQSASFAKALVKAQLAYEKIAQTAYALTHGIVSAARATANGVVKGTKAAVGAVAFGIGVVGYGVYKAGEVTVKGVAAAGKFTWDVTKDTTKAAARAVYVIPAAIFGEAGNILKSAFGIKAVSRRLNDQTMEQAYMKRDGVDPSVIPGQSPQQYPQQYPQQSAYQNQPQQQYQPQPQQGTFQGYAPQQFQAQQGFFPGYAPQYQPNFQQGYAPPQQQPQVPSKKTEISPSDQDLLDQLDQSYPSKKRQESQVPSLDQNSLDQTYPKKTGPNK